MNTGTLQIAAQGDREIVMTREFNAPRRLVFDAWTKPELLKRWLGVMEGWSWAVCEVDLRVGGAYRYLWHGPDGAVMGMRGIHREIVAPERLVCTEAFDESWYPGEAVWTVVLVEQDGKTALTQTVEYESREARDAVLATPMAEGVTESYDKLAEVLATLA
ncbi:MAG: SRPBCC family protein [Chloroflexi bacterium]|nr:SRPBCC family protein [Chloroflexota bacterium]